MFFLKLQNFTLVELKQNLYDFLQPTAYFEVSNHLMINFMKFRKTSKLYLSIWLWIFAKTTRWLVLSAESFDVHAIVRNQILE